MPKGDRHAARRGRGEFERPDQPILVARYLFLSEIHRLAPSALDALERSQDPIAWAATFGLHKVGWFIDVARETLHMWQQVPSLRKCPIWGTLGIPGRPVHELPDLPAWRYEDESEADFDSRIEDHKRVVKSMAAERGLVRSRELRQPLHVEWLVRRLIQKWSLKDIAQEYDTEDKAFDLSTIDKGTISAAAMIGLPHPGSVIPESERPF